MKIIQRIFDSKIFEKPRRELYLKGHTEGYTKAMSVVEDKNDKESVLSSMGLILTLLHNNKDDDIDNSDIELVIKTARDMYDGDEDKALDDIKKLFLETVNKIKGRDRS